MYIYDKIFEEPFYSSKIFDFYYKDSEIIGEENACIGVFDIETTGLDPKNGQVIMGAVLTKVNGGLRVRQFFTENEGEEEELLILYKKALDETDVLISYNGNGFDFPYLKYRLKRHHLDESFKYILSLDMFSVLNKYSDLRRILPNLKQKTIEEYLGLSESRKDMIDGGKSVEIYFRFLEEKSDELKDIMLLHNRDDVFQLSRILWIFDKLDIHKIALYTGFPIISGCVKVLVTSINVKTKRVDIRGRYSRIAGRHHLFRDDCTVIIEPECIEITAEEENDFGDINISIPLRYEHKVSFVFNGDVNIDRRFFTEGGLSEAEYIILKKDGHTDYKMANLFVKYMVKDILKEICYN